MDLQTADEYIKKGSQHIKKEEYKEAIEEFKKAEPIIEMHLPNSERLTYIYNEIGESLRNIGNYLEAKGYYEKMLAIEEGLIPNTMSIAISYNNFGLCLSSLHKYDKALEFHKKSMTIRENLDPNSKNCAIAYNNLGLLYKELKNFQEALIYYRKAEDIKKVVEPGTVSEAITLNNIGAIYRDMGKTEEAVDYYKRAIKIREEVAPNVLSSSYPYMGYARLLNSLNKKEEALPYAQKALKIREANLIENHPYLISDSLFLSELCLNLKKIKECEEYCDYLLTKDNKSKHAYYYKACCAFEKGKTTEAIDLCDVALDIDANYADAKLKKIELLLLMIEEAEKKNDKDLLSLTFQKAQSEIESAKNLQESDYKEKKMKEFSEKMKGFGEKINPDVVYFPNEAFDVEFKEKLAILEKKLSKDENINY